MRSIICISMWRAPDSNLPSIRYPTGGKILYKSFQNPTTIQVENWFFFTSTHSHFWLKGPGRYMKESWTTDLEMYRKEIHDAQSGFRPAPTPYIHGKQFNWKNFKIYNLELRPCFRDLETTFDKNSRRQIWETYGVE